MFQMPPWVLAVSRTKLLFCYANFLSKRSSNRSTILQRTYAINRFYTNRDPIVHVRSADKIARQIKYSWHSNDLNEQDVMSQLVHFTDQCKKEGTIINLGVNLQPLFWKYQPLITVDPILPCDVCQYFAERYGTWYWRSVGLKECLTSSNEACHSILLSTLSNELS